MRFWASLFMIMIVLLAVPVLAENYEQVLKDAEAAYAVAMKIKAEKGEGAIFQERPYQKDLDKAKRLYWQIIDEQRGSVALRRKLADNIDRIITLPQWQGEYLEEMLSAEIALLPPVLYANAALTYRDLSKGPELFLPPLVEIADKNKEAWGGGPVPAAGGGTSAAVKPAVPAGLSFDKATFDLILNSGIAQEKYINGQFSRAGEAPLFQAFYNRLNAALSYYRQAQGLIPKIVNSPNFTDLQLFKARMARIKLPEEFIRYEDIDQNFDRLREQAAALVECVKVPLPRQVAENMDPEGFDFARLDGKYKDIISREREALLNQFKTMTKAIYYFNLFDLTPEMLAALEPGTGERITGLRKLTEILSAANEYRLGYQWNNQPDCRYLPRNGNAALDLSEVKARFGRAQAAYQASGDKRGLGLLYLSQIAFDPQAAGLAVSNLKAAGEDAESLLALEYAYCLMDRAQNDPVNYNLAIETCRKIPAASDLRAVGSAFLGQEILFKVLAKTNERIINKGTYTECVAKLEEAKPLDPDNAYLDLLQGYFTFRRGTTMSVEDALSVMAASLMMGVKHVMVATDFMSEAKGLQGDPKAYEKMEGWADAKGKQLEEEYEKEFGFNNEIVVRKYVPEDFLQAVAAYQRALSKDPKLAMAYYYLGRAYAVLGLYYSVQKDQAKADQYKALAQESLKKFLLMSYSG